MRLEHAPPNEKLYANPLLGVQATGNSNAIRGVVAAAAQGRRDRANDAGGGGGQALEGRSGFLPRTKRRSTALADGPAPRPMASLPPTRPRMPVPDKVALKEPKDFKLIGTPAKRLDLPAKVNGTAVFGIDARPPGVKIATLGAIAGVRRPRQAR